MNIWSKIGHRIDKRGDQMVREMIFYVYVTINEITPFSLVITCHNLSPANEGPNYGIRIYEWAAAKYTYKHRV